ncbi:diguanylate cyclase [Shewanella colwelliana]|uniref:diguanylate cyclase n=1 Tax=Shewanella colwelliana TaxID=23 RepID=A0A1E5IZ31_SHECO|nr:GGDEF domain-containing protein [Shewanella colwelliana]MDX1281725.1 GGDEF domain-containing protein [Shewanella colwelliana]OEG75093.1 deoxycytidylate deaminase [Shewanella colwelliana]GIU21209.1 diguanylate cyclase [Shewanella colwelliana]GIU37414.1 diguanylate cyclase [Shewanella colwelliana]
MDFALATEFSPDEYRFQPEYQHARHTEPNLVSMMQQLHESLDPRTVFACYGKLMGQYLPVHGVKLHCKEYQLSWGSEQGLQIKQAIGFAGEKYELAYQLIAPLVPSQAELLYQMQDLLLLPLFNAIKYDQMARQAMHDALTGLGNRHYYNEAITKSLARSQRHGEMISLVILDLDNFKKLNDQYGHLVGDDVLSTFGQTLKQAIRDTDQAFRIGGDEFLVIVEGDTLAARILCERVLDIMNHHPLLNKFNVQSSLGAAQWCSGDTSQDLYLRADKALYRAKASGRRCYKIDGQA